MNIRKATDGTFWRKATDGQWHQVDEAGNVPVSQPQAQPIPKKKFDAAAEQKRLMDEIHNGMSFGEKALVGAGRELDKLGTGIADLADIALGGIGIDTSKRRAQRKAEQAELDGIYQQLSDDSPWATGIGQALPYLATLPVGVGASTARGATHLAVKQGGIQTAKELAALMGKEAAFGAGAGAAHYNDTALEGAAWGAGGALGGKALGNLLGGSANKLNAETQRIVDYAKKHGFYVPSGMATGNSRLQQMDQALAKHSATADKVHDAMIDTRQKQNQIIAKELGGGPADILSTDYLDTQRERIGSKMDELVKGTTGRFTDDHAYQITDIIDNFRNTDPGQKSRAILDKFENRIYDMADAGKELTGEQFQRMTSQLNKAASKQFNSVSGDRELGSSLSDIANIFNDAIGDSMGAANKADWAKARKQYALLTAIEKAKIKTTRKGMAGIQGYVDPDILAKEFRGSKAINQMAEVENLRRAQPGASLSTSGLLGRALNVSQPMEQMGSLMLLSGRLTHSLPVIPDIATGLYMRGWPHATGLAPIFGRKLTQPVIERAVPRVLISQDKDERDEYAY